MEMVDKLNQLLKTRNKTDVAEQIGVSRSLLSKYSNRGTTPPIQVALKLARILGVPLDWLVDDEADFPIPQVSGKRIEDYPHHELMTEVARRLLRAQVEDDHEIEAVESVDWLDIAQRLIGPELGQADPEALAALEAAERFWHGTKQNYMRFDARYWADRVPETAGGMTKAEYIGCAEELRERRVALRETNAAFGLAVSYRAVADALDQEGDDGKELAKMHRDKLLKQLEAIQPPKGMKIGPPKKTTRRAAAKAADPKVNDDVFRSRGDK